MGSRPLETIRYATLLSKRNSSPDHLHFRLSTARRHMATPPLITGSILYDLVACPHRVTMDLFANPSERDAVSPFLRLLWERGTARENEVIAAMKEPILNLSTVQSEEKEQLTLAAMDRDEALIYGGGISCDGLGGGPGLFFREEKEEGGRGIKSCGGGG